MNDAELVVASGVPEPIGQAFLNHDEAALEVLLDLLFACHYLVDDPEQEDGKWYNMDIAWPIYKLYDSDSVPPVLSKIAPTWQDAIRVSEEWLAAFPHSCNEFDWWAWQRDQWQDPSVVNFTRELLATRIPPN